MRLRKVGPNLFVGALDSPLSFDGFAGIVDLYGSTLGAASPQGPVVSGTKTPLLSIPFNDGAHFPAGALDAVHEFVARHRRRGPVLVHCQAGLSRSCSAVTAILAKQDKITLREALRRVQAGTERPDLPRRATLESAINWVRAKSLV